MCHKFLAPVSCIALIAVATFGGTAPVKQSQTSAQKFPASSQETGPAFNMSEWVRGVAKIDHDSWDRNHPIPYNTWFAPDSDECARNYAITWGPLGIRTLMHDHTWGDLPAFRRAWPSTLLDSKGELRIDCFEVLSVIPGSPADGRLQPGDLLVAIDGARFTTAMAVRPEQPLMQHQGSRSLELDAGERLDAAEGRGHVAFDVIRPAQWSAAWRGPELSGTGQREVEIQIPVKDVSAVRLVLELTRGRNDYCWVNVIRPRLEGPDKTLDLSDAPREESRTGWGKIQKGLDAGDRAIQDQGEAEPKSIGLHAAGTLAWSVPTGYSTFKATVVAGNERAIGFRPRVETRQRMMASDESIVHEAQVTGEFSRNGLRQVELDVPVRGGQELTVLLETTGNGNGGCWANLIRPRLEGPAKAIDLSNVRRTTERTGWRQVLRGADVGGQPIKWQGAEVKASLGFHANGQLTWAVPAGAKRFRATLALGNDQSAGYRARVLVRDALTQLPPDLASLHRVIAFDIPKIGTYGKAFPDGNDAKSAMVARMTAAWLAGQQQPDGSWKRTIGYTHNGYDTSWAALGLLAQADPAYDANIRKAAEYIAFKCPQDGWSVPSASMVMFLSEYWLRTQDNRVLVPLQTQVYRLAGEMIYGDFNSGHGLNPGYRGTGVSIGGSHVTLAMALANLTPVKIEPKLVDRMLERAQELAPDGFIPYGRDTGTRKFEPNLQGGGTYSGRHGPYLIASFIHGGPRLFTENCTAMYARGAVGGIDQGHATQSLSMTWALLAAANVSPAALERHMAAMRWKLTMLRDFEGGFLQNAIRLEYQGGEGLLPNYLRSGAYLIILNAPKRNLAITGMPKYRTGKLVDVPPVCDSDAVALSYYQRNWGIADAVLAGKSPPRLKAGLTRLLAMGRGSETRKELFTFLKVEALPAAREVLAIEGIESPLRQYLAEMVLGVDLRLSVEPEADPAGKEEPIKWKVQMDAQHPLAGYFDGASAEEKQAWRKQLPLPMEGTVTLAPGPGAALGTVTFPIEKALNNDGWQVMS